MSRDIYVQDIPSDVASVEEIPDGWMPGQLPCSAERVRAAVVAVAPNADFSDPTWGHIELPGIDIEVSLDDAEVLDSFAFHLRGDDSTAAEKLVGDVLARLGLRALDPEGSESGIFQPPE